MTIPVWYWCVSVFVFVVGIATHRKEWARDPYEVYTHIGIALTWPASIPIDFIRYWHSR